MTKTIQSIVVASIILLLSAGCAQHYTNSELINIFNAKGLNTKETDRGVVVFLPEVYFEFNSTKLTQGAHDKLLAIGGVLIDPKTVTRQVSVEGHTDSIGDSTYNEDLSLRRANAVSDDLVLRDVSNDRITRRGFGEKYPIAPNSLPNGQDNPEGRAQNRRVEIVIENLAIP